MGPEQRKTMFEPISFMPLLEMSGSYQAWSGIVKERYGYLCMRTRSVAYQNDIQGEGT